MSINKATMIKLQKQTSVAMSEMNNKKIVDDALFTPRYNLVCLVTGRMTGPMTLDDAMKRDDWKSCRMERV